MATVNSDGCQGGGAALRCFIAVAVVGLRRRVGLRMGSGHAACQQACEEQMVSSRHGSFPDGLCGPVSLGIVPASSVVAGLPILASRSILYRLQKCKSFAFVLGASRWAARCVI